MMIEINKRIYLKNDSKLDIKKYRKLKKCMLNFYNILNIQVQNRINNTHYYPYLLS